MPSESKTNRLLFNPRFFQNLEIGLIDAGARGELPEPWNFVSKPNLFVAGFEPDADEAARLNAEAGENAQYYPIGLWSKKKKPNCTWPKNLRLQVFTHRTSRF